MNKKICILVAMVCAGCSAESRNLAELRRLCEEDAGFSVYRTVQAAGYYDASQEGGILRLLIPSEFSFMEFCELEVNIASTFDEPGCWRLTKASRETGQCSETIDGALASSGARGYQEFRVDSCIEVRKLENPEARYSYHSDITEWQAENGFSNFIKSEVYVNDSFNNAEELGRYTSYYYTHRPGLSGSVSCSTFDEKFPTFAETNFVNSIISPTFNEE